jgi:hypothetical protein
MKKVILSCCCLIIVLRSGLAQEPVPGTPQFVSTFPAPSVDKRIELLSIVFRLAGNWEYNDEQYKSYTADIHSHFDQYKDHELISFAGRLCKKNGVSFDAVMKMAIHLSAPPDLNPVVPFTEDVPERRWGKEQALKFVKLLQQFYVDARCDAFFEAHEQLYKTVPERFTKVYEALDINWYQQYYGVQPNGRLIVILGLGNGCGNYGPKITWPGGREDNYAIMGVCPLDSLEQPKYSIEDNLPTLIHEFNHSFVNHLTDQYRAEFKDSGEKLYGIVKESMRRQAYGNWQTMLNEALVRASVVRYYLKHDPDSTVAKAKMITEFNNGFFWISDLVNCLGAYEANRNRYPTLETYMPVLVDFYTKTAGNSGSLFKIKK